MKQSYNIIIPARYASSRLPAKPLIKIAGKTMLQHTYQRACKSSAEKVIIATDDSRIEQSAREYTDNIVLTSKNHQSGTDRLAEVVKKLDWDDNTIVVNVQGDEPLILAEHIEQVAQLLASSPQAGLSTLSYKISNYKELFDPNVVKVVSDIKGYAMYFSRSAIPFNRDQFSDLSRLKGDIDSTKTAYYRHIGLYAYRAKFLKKYQSLSPAPTELTESLEQLRALYYGIKIAVAATETQPGHGVDVAADLKCVEEIINEQSS